MYSGAFTSDGKSVRIARFSGILVKAEHLDVLVVGAGISGIGAGYHLQTHCPDRTFAILEARDTLGGTWDLFRYPGIRSDSDMYTLGYSFRPWTGDKAIADGASILAYLRETAAEYGIDRKIRYGCRVRAASWSTLDSRWTVEVEDTKTGDVSHSTCKFLYVCGGYYRYDEGYTPELPGRERFTGRIVHPQKWTEDIEYAGKKVVVIGSGATAVTLVPNLAKAAAHVTMLQRSPTYIISLPGRDARAAWLRAHLPARLAYAFTRWKNVILSLLFYRFCRRFPDLARNLVLHGVRRALGTDFDVAPHFTPTYAPWDQRLCLVPDGDLFASIRDGKVTVVTDHIDTFTERGIRLRSGNEIEADLVVTATGLVLQPMGGLTATVDGEPFDASKALTYKGFMCSDLPNLAFAVGYTNASWTLKCDLTSEFVCRVLNHMRKSGYTQCVPRRNDPMVTEQPLIDFSSGYVQRSIAAFPKQGSIAPWRLYQNYPLDLFALRYAPLEDGVLQFSGRKARGLHAAPVASLALAEKAGSGNHAS